MVEIDFNAQFEFAQALAKDPDLLKKMKARAELDAFKEKFNVERASPFKCPSCSQFGMSPGSLWMVKGTNNKFACRRCEMLWEITCNTKSNEEAFWDIKKLLESDIGKGKGKEPKNDK